MKTTKEVLTVMDYDNKSEFITVEANNSIIHCQKGTILYRINFSEKDFIQGICFWDSQKTEANLYLNPSDIKYLFSLNEQRFRDTIAILYFSSPIIKGYLACIMQDKEIECKLYNETLDFLGYLYKTENKRKYIEKIMYFYEQNEVLYNYLSNKEVDNYLKAIRNLKEFEIETNFFKSFIDYLE
jgi:hypothetical protein